jgi:2-succinyl-5-enolpyruvyl-6-hydroxy-3-cyclohexene-1-carboxylate synthase
MALALARRADELPVHLFHDERSASFAALGHAAATGRPSILLCTSGTAAAHFHAAVIEADLSSIPLIVCTADRPPELVDVGAPQTIDQVRLYGSSVRFACEPGVPEWAMAGSWRSVGSRLVAEADGASGRPGPVHANLGFRDPLDAAPGELPAGRPDGKPWHGDIRHQANDTASPTQVARVFEVLASRASGGAAAGAHGVLVAGRGAGETEPLLELSRRLGWPILADHRSGCRVPGQTVAHADALLRTDALARPLPDVVVRFGEAPASKVVAQWLRAAADAGASTVAALAARRSRWIDPDRRADILVDVDGLAAALVENLEPSSVPSPERQRWLDADRVAASAIDGLLDSEDPTSEPAVARAVLADLPPGGCLVVSSSMPVRDVEWFGANRCDVEVFANRGANGIDGVLATAIGVALSGRPTTVLLGDVAFLHDATSLTALAQRSVALSIVVVDNDGGGIFSFLPQAQSVAAATFETLYGTPHGTDLVALAQAHGLDAHRWEPGRSTAPIDRTRVWVADTGTRHTNVEVHRRLNDAVAEAVAATMPAGPRHVEGGDSAEA